MNNTRIISTRIFLYSYVQVLSQVPIYSYSNCTVFARRLFGVYLRKKYHMMSMSLRTISRLSRLLIDGRVSAMAVRALQLTLFSCSASSPAMWNTITLNCARRMCCILYVDYTVRCTVQYSTCLNQFNNSSSAQSKRHCTNVLTVLYCSVLYSYLNN